MGSPCRLLVPFLERRKNGTQKRERDYLDTLDQRIKTFYYTDEPDIETDHRVFVFLQDAVVNREIIAIEYYSPFKDQHTERNVESLGLLIRDNYWYLAEWCRLHTGYRMFRVDRIKHYKASGNRLPKLPEHTLKKFYNISRQEEENHHEVRVRFDHEKIHYLSDQKHYRG